jgi:hypothetical protein
VPPYGSRNKLLAGLHRLRQVGALRQLRCDRGRIRTTRSVRRDARDEWRGEFRRSNSIVQNVHGKSSAQVTALL